jgi:hypothetical protein
MPLTPSPVHGALLHGNDFGCVKSIKKKKKRQEMVVALSIL